MTKLMAALLSDPDASFEVEADFPSGNGMRGVVGPILNGKVCAHLTFVSEPVSAEDRDFAQRVMNEAIGLPPAVAIESHSESEHSAAMERVRRFFGGGQG